MKLEEQVCSLELSKKLKELGVKQESIWYWVAVNNKVQRVERVVDENKFVEVMTKHEAELDKISYPKIDFEILCSAFTVAELGGMLPINISINTYHCFLEIFRDSDIWEIKYVGGMKNELSIDIIDKTEANARAKMLIYLIEKGYLKEGEKL